MSICARTIYSEVLFDGFTRKKFADRAVESFAVFKEGITPEWEDPENKNGGEWSIRKGAFALGLLPAHLFFLLTNWWI